MTAPDRDKQRVSVELRAGGSGPERGGLYMMGVKTHTVGKASWTSLGRAFQGGDGTILELR